MTVEHLSLLEGLESNGDLLIANFNIHQIQRHILTLAIVAFVHIQLYVVVFVIHNNTFQVLYLHATF